MNQDVRSGGRQSNAQYQYTIESDDLNQLQVWADKLTTTLKANPDLTYQVGAKVVKARAEIADPERRKQLWERLVAKHKGYADYQKKTTREIPMVTLKPVN